MAVPNTLLLEQWAVADWDEWSSLPESIQNSAVLFPTKNLHRTRKSENFQRNCLFSFSFKSFQLFDQMYFHIFYILAWESYMFELDFEFEFEFEFELDFELKKNF